MKMTLKEFWESKEKLAINCTTEEQAKMFCEKSQKLGKKWLSGSSYLENNNWGDYEEKTCYSNTNDYGTGSSYKSYGYKILQFEDIDWSSKTYKITSGEERLLQAIFGKNESVYSFRIVESRRSVSLYENDELLKRVYCHEEDTFDWKVGLGIALQRTVYANDKDVLYLSKVLKYKNMALFCLNKFCGYDLSKLEQKVANRKREDKLIKF